MISTKEQQVIDEINSTSRVSFDYYNLNSLTVTCDFIHDLPHDQCLAIVGKLWRYLLEGRYVTSFDQYLLREGRYAYLDAQCAGRLLDEKVEYWKSFSKANGYNWTHEEISEAVAEDYDLFANGDD